jgi:hypothetical protein
MPVHPPPPPAAAGEDPARIVREFWDSFEELLNRHNQQLAADGQAPLNWNDLCLAAGIRESTFSDWRTKPAVPSDPARLVKAAVSLGGSREEWQARWRRARDAHERVLASRRGQRKTGSAEDPAPALPSLSSASGDNDSADGTPVAQGASVGGISITSTAAVAPMTTTARAARIPRPRIRVFRVPWLVPAVIAALLLVVGVVIAVRALQDPGTTVPSATDFDTGPGTGIAVTPPAKTCGSARDGFRSPAAVTFSSVSLVEFLSLDGRNAMVMQGTYDGKVYYWIQSNPTGLRGGMWLHWSMNGSSYCTVTIPGGPVSVLPGRVASMAVPVIINGDQVTFGACLWYQSGYNKKCWGNL